MRESTRGARLYVHEKYLPTTGGARHLNFLCNCFLLALAICNNNFVFVIIFRRISSWVTLNSILFDLSATMPKSRFQQYRLTAKGKAWLEQQGRNRDSS